MMMLFEEKKLRTIDKRLQILRSYWSVYLTLK